MSKNKTFPFYFQDWLTSKSVRMLTKQQRADYIDLLCYLACEAEKGIEDDNEVIKRLLACDDSTIEALKKRLVIKEGRIYSKKLSDSMSTKKISKKQSGGIFNVPKGISDVSEIIKIKKEQFVLSLKDFSDKYSRELLNDFYKYWTEPTHDKSSLRMELQKTWDYESRLNTWAKRNLNKYNNSTATTGKAQKLIDANSGAKNLI